MTNGLEPTATLIFRLQKVADDYRQDSEAVESELSGLSTFDGEKAQAERDANLATIKATIQRLGAFGLMMLKVKEAVDNDGDDEKAADTFLDMRDALDDLMLADNLDQLIASAGFLRTEQVMDPFITAHKLEPGEHYWIVFPEGAEVFDHLQEAFIANDLRVILSDTPIDITMLRDLPEDTMAAAGWRRA